MTCEIFTSTQTFRFTTPYELVSLLRQAHNPILPTNTEYMRSIAKQAPENSTEKINTFSEEEFIADLERLGLLKIKLSFFERHFKKPSTI